jgi:hypothetical protein
MHDIDRTQLETNFGGELTEEWEFNNQPELYGEAEYPYGELYEDAFGETDGEYEGMDSEENFEGPFNETDEMELAAELLSVGNEAELDQFLGKFIGKVIKVAKPFIKPLGNVLKGIAKKALSVGGGALGSFIPIPGVGTAIGSALGSAAGKMFGLELEGMSQEDQEFEVARRFVRLAGDTARIAASAPVTANPKAVVNGALTAAAKRHAPGLLHKVADHPIRRQRGHWVRYGRKIILYGV